MPLFDVNVSIPADWTGEVCHEINTLKNRTKILIAQTPNGTVKRITNACCDGRTIRALGQSSRDFVTHRRAQILLSPSECAFDFIVVDQVINLIMPKYSGNTFINELNGNGALARSLASSLARWLSGKELQWIISINDKSTNCVESDYCGQKQNGK